MTAKPDINVEFASGAAASLAVLKAALFALGGKIDTANMAAYPDLLALAQMGDPDGPHAFAA